VRSRVATPTVVAVAVFACKYCHHCSTYIVMNATMKTKQGSNKHQRAGDATTNIIAAVKARDSDPEVKEGRFRNQESSTNVTGAAI
jgi:hypothetical protein